ncbi:NAD(P)/FAD-dependent oxidoreductase [Enterococcus sp. OL5]|uniref:NAD(P)/FAD-dependent oxidoreductase n=1 Tax=Enterococcus sp. OL5 TaxID=2590214 RepID=UPI001126A9AE|nr:FAD-dependent oxidoreductase [Enterococcus sp. OL5]TPR58095.1 FAD-binding oxidoreductase [Enterococcus sp. OL5]
MKKVVIIGGGIIGLTLANYLDKTKFDVTVIDSLIGQATSASAGIISPWLSKRRNKKWYQLAQDGAAFFPKLVRDFALDESIYAPCGTLVVRPEKALQELAELAENRRKAAPEIGEIDLLTGPQTKEALPLLKEMPSLRITGGGRLDGQAYLAHLKANAQQQQVTFIEEKAEVVRNDNHWQIKTKDHFLETEILCLTAGPGLLDLLSPLGYQVDIRPQKGQLLSFATNLPTNSWPVAMLEGEGDLIPFSNGQILLGATHENDAGWDLTPTEAAKQQLMTGIGAFLEDPEALYATPMTMRVGTRAYTSDFAPFFGEVPDEANLFAASGLGSSGLTTGPYIGYLLANRINDTHTQPTDFSIYTKPMTEYIKKRL